MIGKRLAHYEVLEKLGEGGMGEVYLAEDHELGRRVALKVLNREGTAGATLGGGDLLARFRREARAVAALNHPNIVTIHSVETAAFDGDDEPLSFLTMELIEGESLDRAVPSGGMTAQRIFAIGTALAGALDAAHKQGITHRDLKPANVMLTPEGRVKVLDFGLAKLQETPTGEEGETTEALTQAGLVLGTVPYMSPEQIGGKDVDHRTDIFSLGVLLHEMAVGERPFSGESSGHVVSAILRDEPPPVTEIREELPHHLGRIIRRCLEKDPDRRYQSALDVRNELEALAEEVRSGAVSSARPPSPPRTNTRALVLAAVGALVLGGAAWWLTRPTADERPPAAESPVAASGPRTVVVLPFENLGSPEDEYFAAGITDEITSRLAGVDGLHVISRNSAARYAGTDKSLPTIGEELGADHVLTGTIRWAGGDEGSRVRITPQLIRADDDIQLWSNAYDRVLADVFEVQSDIADQVVGQLGLTLRGTEQESGGEAPTENLEAYQAYLRGRELMRQLGYDAAERGEAAFLRAVELDPDFAQPWAELAHFYANRHFAGDFRRDHLPLAREALDRALALDPDSPAVQLAHGYYLYYGERNFDAALEVFQTVARARPSDAEAQSAIAYIHRRQGEIELAAHKLERALQLDPQSLELISNLAGTWRALRRFEDQIEVLDRGIALAPDQDELYEMKALARLEGYGDVEGAREALSRAPGSDDLFEAWVEIEWMAEDWEAALDRLRNAKPKNPFEEMGVTFQTGATYWLMDRPEEGRRYMAEALEALDLAIGDRDVEGGILLARAIALAGVGRAEEAIADAERALEGAEDDRFNYGDLLENKALVHAILGQTDAGIEILTYLVDLEYSDAITRIELERAPHWRDFRADPRFVALLAGAG